MVFYRDVYSGDGKVLYVNNHYVGYHMVKNQSYLQDYMSYNLAEQEKIKNKEDY